MSPVAKPRHRAPARYRVYLSLGRYFVEDTFTADVVASFSKEWMLLNWIRDHA